MVFPVVMEWYHKEGWVLKNWCFWTVVLEKTLENPLDCKEIQPVHPKGDQSWIFIGRTDAEAETPILWPPDTNNWFLGKDPDAGKDWRQEEKGTTEDEMVSPMRWTWVCVNSRVGDGQGGLVCCSSWGRRGSDITEHLNWLCTRHWSKHFTSVNNSSNCYNNSLSSVLFNYSHNADEETKF